MQQPGFRPEPYSTILMRRFAEKGTCADEQFSQISSRIADRSMQVTSFIRSMLTRDQESINAYYGRQLLQAVGGGDVSDRAIREISEFGWNDRMLRMIFSAIDEKVSPDNALSPKVAELDTKSEVANRYNEEQSEAVGMKATRRIEGIIHMIRTTMRKDDHFELGNVLRYAGGDDIRDDQARSNIRTVATALPYGPKIFSEMEKTIGTLGVHVNEELEPLIRMKQNLLSGHPLSLGVKK